MPGTNVNLTEVEQFVITGAGGIAGPIAELASPANGEQLTALDLNARRSIDITYRSLDGTALDIRPRSPTTSPFKLTGTGLADVELDPLGRPIIAGYQVIGGLHAGRPDVTIRYYLKDKDAKNLTDLFQAGTVNVEFFDGDQRLQDDAPTSANLAGLRSTFTLSPTAPGALAATKPITLGPLTLQNPTIGIADVGFSPDGMLVLTIAIGVERATLAFGAPAPRRPARRQLTQTARASPST